MHRQDWGRFDILGQTFYVAENHETAYAEVLAGFKLSLFDHSLERVAHRFGITLT
ncbi:hypothetical protein RS85_02958 [Microbacterium sp. SA39]|nr:hypothetical protein RS85_02958 [Microbacterium sp. SA39]